jgi:hypothetical protein
VYSTRGLNVGAGGSMGATLPLYTGGRLRAMAMSTALGKQAAFDMKRATESDVTLQALTAFWTWSKAFHSQSALEAALARAGIAQALVSSLEAILRPAPDRENARLFSRLRGHRRLLPGMRSRPPNPWSPPPPKRPPRP